MTHEPPNAGLQALARIDALCMQFEDAWLSGQRPRPETWLERLAPTEQAHLLRELLPVEWEYRRRTGEMLVLDEYLARFPNHRTLVETAFEQLPDEVPVSFGPGQKIGRYRVERQLGSGGFGSVFLAFDDQLQRQVAVKVPRRRQLLDPDTRERFMREARTVARLKHPAIVPVFDVGQLDDGTVFIVMPHVDGCTLRELQHAQRLSWRRVAEMITAIAAAVDHAHLQGFVHRDLKPANVIIDRHGAPHVTDFGLAAGHDAAAEPDMAGTLPYMAPEHFGRDAAEVVDARADIWALGVMLHELLSGELPFDKSRPDELIDTIRTAQPAELPREVPRHLRRAVARCLAKDPIDRFATARQLATALRPPVRSPRAEASIRLLTMVAACMATLLTGWALLARTPWGAAPGIHGSVDLLVWNESEGHRQGIRLHEPGALPLRAGDHIRIEARLSRPAYLYLVWIDGHGKATGVYPGQPGSWTDKPARSKKPVELVTLPADDQYGWPMKAGSRGMETLVLLARDRPLPDGESLEAVFADLAPQPLTSGRRLAMFENGWPADIPLSQRDRSPSFGSLNHIKDPLLRNQRRIARRLDKHFHYFRAISFACDIP